MKIRLHYIPLTMFVFPPILFAITYTIAVKLDHINAFYSYISDTGTIPPEMCIFGMGLSVFMVLGLLFSYIRYKQVEAFLHGNGRTYCQRTNNINTVGMYVGYATSFGIGIVGAFQETNALIVHILGAGLAFFGGSFFFIIQGYLTKIMAPHFGSKRLAFARMVTGVLCAILYLACQGTGVVALGQFKGNESEIVKWEPRHGAWGLRITSTVTEWIMFALFQLYFLSFVPEFTKITFVPPEIITLLHKETSLEAIRVVASTNVTIANTDQQADSKKTTVKQISATQITDQQ